MWPSHQIGLVFYLPIVSIQNGSGVDGGGKEGAFSSKSVHCTDSEELKYQNWQEWKQAVGMGEMTHQRANS
jgi:hypothetical protein